MPGRIRMIMKIAAVILLFVAISFILLANFYPPLNLKLFGGEFSISPGEIQFWVKKVPQRNYYHMYGRYLKNPKTANSDFGHGIFFKTKMKNGANGSIIVFNPEDNKLYGGGWSGLQGDAIVRKDSSEWERVFYYLGEGKFEGSLFKPIFPEGTKFTFLTGGSIVITDAPAYHIKIYLPGTLKKLEKEELEKGALAEIAEDEGPARRKRKEIAEGSEISYVPLLKVKIKGPGKVSPGQTFNFTIEYGNDGSKDATEALVFVSLPPDVNYISASEGAFYNSILNTVDWNLGAVPAKSSGYLSIQVEANRDLPIGATFEANAVINDMTPP